MDNLYPPKQHGFGFGMGTRYRVSNDNSSIRAGPNEGRDCITSSAHETRSIWNVVTIDQKKKFTLRLHECLYTIQVYMHAKFTRSFLPIALKIVGQAHVT